MTAFPEMSTESVLLACALRDLHGSWIPDLDAVLLSRAKMSAAGQRWLKARLKKVALFNHPPAGFGLMPLEGAESGWWQVPLAVESRHLIELGALGYLPDIKSSIDRDKVLQWRRVLGKDLYEKLLRVSLGKLPLDTAVATAIPVRVEDAILADMIAMSGFRALFAYASRFHHLLALRVAVAFPQAWSHTNIGTDLLSVPVLPLGAVEQFIQKWSEA